MRSLLPVSSAWLVFEFVFFYDILSAIVVCSTAFNYPVAIVCVVFPSCSLSLVIGHGVGVIFYPFCPTCCLHDSGYYDAPHGQLPSSLSASPVCLAWMMAERCVDIGQLASSAYVDGLRKQSTRPLPLPLSSPMYVLLATHTPSTEVMPPRSALNSQIIIGYMRSCGKRADIYLVGCHYVVPPYSRRTPLPPSFLRRLIPVVNSRELPRCIRFKCPCNSKPARPHLATIPPLR